MRTDYKIKTKAALARLEGLSKKLHQMIEDDAHCPEILQLVLSMQGHLRHIQSHVLESHLHTCAPPKLSATQKTKDDFVAELVSVIGLSRRS